MSHRLYSTDAFVLGSRAVGESNRQIELFTRDFGLVRAVAQGVRFAQSKLRYSLYPYAYVRTTLVKGREVWRITGALEAEPSPFLSDAKQLRIYASLCSLLVRFVHGEEADPELFDELSFLRTLLSLELAAEFSRELELLGAVRILARLGYLGGTPEVAFLVSAPAPARELLFFVRAHYALLAALVERAQKMSHL